MTAGWRLTPISLWSAFACQLLSSNTTTAYWLGKLEQTHQISYDDRELQLQQLRRACSIIGVKLTIRVCGDPIPPSLTSLSFWDNRSFLPNGLHLLFWVFQYSLMICTWMCQLQWTECSSATAAHIPWEAGFTGRAHYIIWVFQGTFVSKVQDLQEQCYCCQS